MTEQMKQPEPAPQPQPAPQPTNAYESIIEQQQAQISALMEQTKMLNEQIVNLVNNGGQLNQFQVQPRPQNTAPGGILPTSLEQNEDYTLESLAKDIGKKPKRV